MSCDLVTLGLVEIRSERTVLPGEVRLHPLGCPACLNRPGAWPVLNRGGDGGEPRWGTAVFDCPVNPAAHTTSIVSMDCDGTRVSVAVARTRDVDFRVPSLKWFARTILDAHTSTTPAPPQRLAQVMKALADPDWWADGASALKAGQAMCWAIAGWSPAHARSDEAEGLTGSSALNWVTGAAPGAPPLPREVVLRWHRAAYDPQHPKVTTDTLSQDARDWLRLGVDGPQFQQAGIRPAEGQRMYEAGIAFSPDWVPAIREVCPFIAAIGVRYGQTPQGVLALATALRAQEDPAPSDFHCWHDSIPSWPFTCRWDETISRRVRERVEQVGAVNWEHVAVALSAGMPLDEAVAQVRSGADVEALRVMAGLLTGPTRP